MKRTKKLIILMLAITVLTVWSSPGKAYAASSSLPYISYNLNNMLIKRSSMVATDQGYERVFFNSEDDKIYIEDYDDSFQITGRRTLNIELSVYGGFFSGKDAYYFVFGDSNTEENTDKEVVRVVKYSKNWQRLGAAHLKGDSSFGNEISSPFYYGNVNMAECDGKLYLVTGHQGYVDDNVGMGHQGFLMFVIDETTMEGFLAEGTLGHSFSQHIAIKDANNIYVLEESEGNRRSQITRKTSSDLVGKTLTTLKYGGKRTSSTAIPTRATADGIALSADNVLAVGKSIDQSRYDDYSRDNVENVYLTVTPMNKFDDEDDFSGKQTKLIWITNYTSEVVLDVNLTKVTDNKFMISWNIRDEAPGDINKTDESSLSTKVLHYIFVDGNGNQIGREYTAAASVSDCQPIVKNGKVVYYASDHENLSFYAVNSLDGKIQKKNYQMAGPDIQWSFSGGVLKLYGKGRMSTSYFGETFGSAQQKTEKIVIGDGITNIAEGAFSGFSNLRSVSIGKNVTEIESSAFQYCRKLERVSIPRGVRKIGDYAFYCCENMSYIEIPSSVTSFGKEILWNDWGRQGQIRCERNSAAQKYAASQGIDYVAAEVKLKDKNVMESGKTVSIDKASVAGRTGEVVYTYYTDSSCKTKTTAAKNGAASEGGAPSKAGVYYVRAMIKGDRVFNDTVSNIAKLTIQAKKTENLKQNTKTLVTPTVERVQNTTRGIQITWRKVSGASLYRVFYKTGNGKWIKLTDTSADHYTWGKAKSGVKYSFTVRCLDKNGKYVSDYNKVGKAIRYIASPNLTAVKNVKGGVQIIWKKSAGASQYRVFRKVPDGKWVKVGDTTKSTFIDKKVKSGLKYTYTVRCLNQNGTFESGYDGKGKTIRYIASPGLNEVTNTKNGIQVSWKKSAGADKYRVFRRTTNGTWHKIGDTSKLSYIDRSVKKGVKYSYTVRCISKDGQCYTSAYDSKGINLKRK